MPTLLPNLKIDLPEIKISPLPAATQNGANSTQKPPPSLAVIMPTLRKIATTAAAVKADQEATPKLQRSNSLGESAENPKIIRVQNNANERRHSVAIMAKELDVIVEQPMHIETITIDDDDSDEEREREAAQKQKEQEKEQEPAIKQPMEQQKPASRKNSTASRNSILSGNSRGSNSNRSSTSSRSSDVELIMEQESQQPVVQKEAMVEEPKQQPEVKQENEVKKQEELKQQIEVKPQEELKPQEESKQREQLKPQEVLKPQPTCNTSTLSIVRAESLPLSKEDFEKSLRCDEALSSSSMSACSSSTQSSEGPECTAIRGYKRSMELNFGMLHWRDQHQPGSLQNSNMRFELNRFNLLQINERCEPRRGPASYFDVALFDRTSRRTSNSSHPLLYLCSRCNCHGPASDFLAPRFCSLACVRRAHKRRQAAAATNARLSKQRRLEESLKQLRANHQKEKERKPKPQKRVFRWSEYLNTKGMGGAAPIHLFMNPFPTGPNCFERGMKLEAIDPENCSLFCVCTIVEVRGYRLKLNFDGYSNMYDFWVNADSIDIFPPGWCERTSRVLQAPKGYCPERFTWYRYLVKTNAKAAPCALFTHLNGPKFALNNGFGVGMHLEAEDLNDTGKICVATIADVLDERVRVHFDGWDDCYDFWVHVNSPYIHPCGWHEGRQQLIVPPDYQNVNFNWSDYIAEAGGTAAPAELFAPRQPLEFQPRMKLEVVDQRNPCLIRPATVVNRKSYRVQLHLDCWPTEYYFWLEDDSPDLHPIGWCEATAHELEVPPGFQQPASTVQCDVMEGCRGYGNAKRFDFNVHAQRDCCPYAPENWRQWRLKTVKPPRVALEEIRQAEPPKPELTEESLEALERRLNNIENSSSSLLKPISQRKRQSVKSRSSSDSEPPEPKVLKHEEEKPLPLPLPLPVVEHKPEPMELLPPPAAECDIDPRCLKIAKSIVEEYGPQIKRNYHLWQTNSGFDIDNLKSNPIYWTTWDVYEFVERALKSTTIAKTLFDEEIDGRALLMLGRKDLANFFQLKVGPTVTLFSLIVNLRIAVVTKFETPRSGLFGDPESFDSPTVNGHHEEAESTTGESMSTSSSGSEQMEEEESQEEEEEEEVEEKVEGEEEEDDEEAEVEDEEDENVEAEEDEENEEDEEAEEDEEEEDEEEEEDDEAEEQTVVIAVNDDESDKQENAESSEEEDELEEDEDEDEVEDEEEDEDEEANEEENEDEEADEDQEGDDDEEADDDEEEDENEEGEVEKDNVANEDQEESEECAVETGEQSKEEQEEEIDADEELQEQETSSELEEPKKEDCADEFLMGEEDEEQESDTEDDEEESNEHDAKNNADENDSDYDAAEESEDLSDDNVDAAADEYDDDGDDYDDKVLEQDLNQSALTQYPKQEPSDEEDVVLDSDDFLSVKPSIVNPEDMDTDVVPTSPHHELLPPVDDLVEDIS